jgi:hypothetical protein
MGARHRAGSVPATGEHAQISMHIDQPLPGNSQGIFVFMQARATAHKVCSCLPSCLMHSNVFWLMLRVYDGNKLITNGLYGE